MHRAPSSQSKQRNGAAGQAAAAHAKHAQKLKTHGKGAQKVHYRGAVGVATRHVKLLRATHRTHPVHRHVPQKAKPKHSSKAKAHLPAGPVDVKQPPTQGGGNGKGNGK